LNRLLTLACAILLPLSAWAHGGEDHGDAPVQAVIASSTPRLSTQTDQFELVGVLQDKVLTLYLDQFGTNTPVPKAQIELESGSWKATATEVSPAVYTVPAELLGQPGKHPLTITVQAGDATDLMDATLEVGPASAAAASVAHSHFWGERAVWLGAGALALAAVALVARRRQKYQRKHRHL
jgi:hypothetical protein